jgi:hypothetical protein
MRQAFLFALLLVACSIRADAPPTPPGDALAPERLMRLEGEKWGGAEGDARRILNLADGSEKPLGEWNTLVVEARGRSLKVWVNGDLVNEGSNATADRGRIALQAEGTEVEFRGVEIGPPASPRN